MPDGGQRLASTSSVEALLDIARRRFGMDVSWVSSFRDGDQVLEHLVGDIDAHGIVPGARSASDGSFCVRVLDGRIPNIVHDARADPVTASLSVIDELGIGSYIGVPLSDVQGTPIGMLCCISADPANHLDDSDVRGMELFAELLGHVLASEAPQDRRDRMIHQDVSATLATGGLRSVFQPIVDIAAATSVGVEALCRFDDPSTRPDDWFAEAASVGLGVDAELAAIAAALNHLDRLAPAMYMSLNASPATINDPRLFEMLASSQPERLVVELTEHDAIGDYDAFVATLSPLRRLGIRLAIDDVGAGFSSFAHVLRLEPDIVKIDRSIVTAIDTDLARQALAAAITGVAERIGALVVAEGVETQAELDTLASLDINYTQGYLLARPGPLGSDINVDAVRAVTPRFGIDEGVSAFSTRRFDLAMEHSPIGMAIVDIDGTFLHANPALARLLGYTQHDLRSLTFQQLTHPDDLDVDLDLLGDCLTGDRDSYRVEKRYIRADDSILWGDLSVVVLRSSAGQPRYFISQIQDATERHHQRRPDGRQGEAHSDPPTDIANRRRAQEYLEQLIADDRTFGILYVDVDGLETINDTHGHHAADHVLIAVETRLTNITRTVDVVVRWGGDRFIVIVPDAMPATFRRLRERAHDHITTPLTLHGAATTTTPCVTIGAAHRSPGSRDSVDQLLHHAHRETCTSRPTARHDSP